MKLRMLHRILALALVVILLASGAAQLLPKAEAASYSLAAPKISALKNTSEGIKITWGKVSGAQKYAVYRKTTGGWSKKATVSGTTYTDKNISSGTVYSYKIRCVNSSGTLLSPNVDGKNKLMALKVPTLKSVSNTENGVKVCFSKPTGTESYQIYRRVGTSGSFTKIGTAKASPYTDTTAKVGTTYYYKVRSVNSTHNTQSALSAMSGSIKYLISPQVTAAVKTPGVKLTWEKVNGAVNYCILRKTATGDWTKKGYTTSTSFVDETAASGSTYQYKVRCVNSKGDKYLSANPTETAKITFMQAPDITALKKSGDGIQIEWSKVGKAESYIIYRKTGDGSWEKRGTADASKNTFLDSPVSACSTYTYTVRSVGPNGAKSGYGVNVKSITLQTAYVTRPQLTLYTNCGDSTPAQMAFYMEEVKYLETAKETTSGAYIRIQYQGKKYYFWQPAGEQYLTGTRSSLSYRSDNSIVQQMLDLSMDMYQNWNIAYRHGESNGIPASDGSCGYDCSGFASYVLKTVMKEHVPTYWVTAKVDVLYETNQIYNQGLDTAFSVTDVDPKRAQPGDLLFFNLADETEFDSSDPARAVTHCGIYLGNNEFIHCTHYDAFGRNGLFISPLTGLYKDGLVAVRRFTPATPTPANQKMYATAYAKIQKEMRSDSTVLETIAPDTEVTVLYTGSAQVTDTPVWAYVSYGDNKTGFVLLKNLTDTLPEISETMYVSATSIRLYSSPASGSDSIDVLIGEQVIYRGRCGTTGYLNVTYNGKQLYLYCPEGESLDGKLTDDLDALMAGIGTRYVARSVNLRSNMDSSTSDSIITLLPAGTKVTLIAVSSSGSWAYVRTESGLYGFVGANYLEQ